MYLFCRWICWLYKRFCRTRFCYCALLSCALLSCALLLLRAFVCALLSAWFCPARFCRVTTATVYLPGWVTSWSVSFNQFYERQHGWFSRRRSTTTSPITFETSYTGFRFGSKFRLNFVRSFSAACVVKLLHTSLRCFLSFQAAMRCGLIAQRLVVISLSHESSPRPSALVGSQSLGQPHGTHSQLTWEKKICRPIFSDLNSKLTFLVTKYLICVFSTLLLRWFTYMYRPGTEARNYKPLPTKCGSSKINLYL